MRVLRVIILILIAGFSFSEIRAQRAYEQYGKNSFGGTTSVRKTLMFIFMTIVNG
jgi:hypothetical protein